jgi:large subunit ribosomal protein L13e
MKYIIPLAHVFKLKGSKQVKVKGKGFSKIELKKTGVSIEMAQKYGLRLDSRRRTAHQKNIDQLKECLNKFSENKKEIHKSKKVLVKSKTYRGNAFRGLTSSGKKARGLMKARGLRNTSIHKWKKKTRKNR